MAGENNKRKQPSHTPFAGCTIIIAAVVVMAFLIGFTIWALFKVSDEVSKFTTSEAIISPPMNPLSYETEFNDLARRLEGFQAQIKLEKATSLKLSPLDINLSIAAHDIFEELRDSLHVTAINSEEMLIAVAYRMNRPPLSKEKGYRYLNGTFHAVPRLNSGQILLDLTKIESLKGIVPPQFVQQLTEHQITAPYLENETLGPIMKKLSAVSLEEGALVLHYDPAKPLVSADPTLEDAQLGLKRFAFIFGGILLLLIIFVVVFLKRQKKKSPTSASSDLRL